MTDFEYGKKRMVCPTYRHAGQQDECPLCHGKMDVLQYDMTEAKLHQILAGRKPRISTGEFRPTIIPPALFTDEQLEQLRAVVREEVRKVAPRQLSWEEVECLEAFLKREKCSVCGLLPVEALLTASALVGTPYQAGHDEKSLGQVAYEAFQQSPEYKRMYRKRFGYNLNVIPWNELLLVEQRVWEEVAEAVLVHTNFTSP